MNQVDSKTFFSKLPQGCDKNWLMSQLSSGITIVTGCDTDVGKTIATAALTAWLKQKNLNVGVVKPAQTGLRDDEPGDLADIIRLAKLDPENTYEFARLPEPLAPTTAARRAGITLPSVLNYAQSIHTVAQNYDATFVEGAGGVLVGLDSAGNGLLELATALRELDHNTPLAFVVVAHPKLGTLNHTLLTCRAIRQAGHRVLGVIFGTWPAEPDLSCQCNLAEISDLVCAPLLFSLPAGIGQDDQAFDVFIRSIDEQQNRRSTLTQ